MNAAIQVLEGRPENKKDQGKKLKDIIDMVEKDYGKGALMRLDGSSPPPQIDSISTGCLAIDIALGVGGLPRGRIVEVFGAESSGKTTLALQVIAQAHAKGHVAAFVDAEHALDPGYAKKLGVKLERLLVSQPGSGEEALGIAESLIQSKAIDVVVVDSVAALVPKAELDGDIGDAHVGLQARLMSQAMRKLTAAIHHSGTVCIFINQIREKIGVMFGNPQTTPGGRALKFYSSVRLEVRRIGAIKINDVVTGNRTKATVVKNKVAPPFRHAEFDLLYSRGISQEGSVLDLAVERGVVTKAGSWILHGSDRLGQGRAQAIANLQGNPSLLATLASAVLDGTRTDTSPGKETVRQAG